MLTQVSSGVKISVDVRYEENLSSILMESFVFSYHITVENQNDFPVQLLRRHWFIFDSIALKREVEGPGVVGETPVILPGEFYHYSSACDLRSMRGTMHGFYTMQRYGEKEFLQVRVPQFMLEVPFCMN
jgi:ApaG protein